MKTIILSMMLAMSSVQAQTEEEAIPPTNQLDVTKPKSSSEIQKLISSFERVANAGIKWCSKPADQQDRNFHEIYEFLHSKAVAVCGKKEDGTEDCNRNAPLKNSGIKKLIYSISKKPDLDKTAITGDKFFKCLLDKKFEYEITRVIGHKDFRSAMDSKKIRAFYRFLLASEKGK